MQTRESLLQYSEVSEEALHKAYDTAENLIIKKLDCFTEKFPDSASKDGFYHPMDNVEWTTGFWTGQIWLAYKKGGDERLRRAGEIQVKSFLNWIQQKIDVNHHDMGFLYSPSCVAAWLLTGNEEAKQAAILAADNLMERFQENGQFFQAWGELGAKDNYRLIIDCLLNMPLLFWAGEVTGDPAYTQRARAHITTAMRYVIRPDHSTYHTYFFDPETGKPVKGVTHQGYRDGSAWARGQAWGIYGSALSYKRLKDEKYADIFCKLTDYFLGHLPSDLIPYWDFDFDDGSSEPRDSSAAAAAVCGMLEMSDYLPQDQAAYYRSMAKRLMAALIDRCAVTDDQVSNGLLLHGTYAKSSPYNTCPNIGVDECNAWGDYYYMEALSRLCGDWVCFW